LAGTDEYGAYVANPSGSTSYSIPFSSLKSANALVLFTTGDLTKWLITTFDQAAGFLYGGPTQRSILQSSTVASPRLKYDSQDFPHVFCAKKIISRLPHQLVGIFDLNL
jgi:hypothetical protein